MQLSQQLHALGLFLLKFFVRKVILQKIFYIDTVTDNFLFFSFFYNKFNFLHNTLVWISSN